MPRSTALEKQGAAQAAPKQSLLDIASTIEELSARLFDASTPEGFELAAEEFNECLSTDLANKVDGYGWYDRKAQAEIAEMKALVVDIEKRIKSKEKARLGMRKLLMYVMLRLNTTMLKGRVTCISQIDGKQSLDVYDEDLIPHQFFEARTVYVLDRDRLKAALENGEVIEGARLKTGDPYLQIK